MGTSRAGHNMLNLVSIKARPRSWWCRQTAIGYRVRLFASRILEGWVFRCRHFLRHWCRVQARVVLSICKAALHAQTQGLQELRSLKYFIEGLRLGQRRTLTCVRRGLNSKQRYHTSSWSWSTQAFGNANNVGPTNSSTKRH